MVSYVLPISQSPELTRRQLNTILADIQAKQPLTGSGSPEGTVTAAIGRLYINTAGGASTTLYVKTSGSGNTGWTAK